MYASPRSPDAGQTSKRGVSSRSEERSAPPATCSGSAPRRNTTAPPVPSSVIEAPSTTSQLCSRSATTVTVVLLEELRRRSSRVSPMRDFGWRRIDVVRVDLERHQVERGKARWLHDRHVVGGPDRRAGDVRAGAGAEVRHPAVDRRSHRVDQRQAVKRRDQPEAVATGDKDRLGSADRRARIASAVHTGDIDAMRRKPTPGIGRWHGRDHSGHTGSSPRAGHRGDAR